MQNLSPVVDLTKEDCFLYDRNNPKRFRLSLKKGKSSQSSPENSFSINNEKSRPKNQTINEIADSQTKSSSLDENHSTKDTGSKQTFNAKKFFGNLQRSSSQAIKVDVPSSSTTSSEVKDSKETKLSDSNSQNDSSLGDGWQKRKRDEKSQEEIINPQTLRESSQKISNDINSSSKFAAPPIPNKLSVSPMKSPVKEKPKETPKSIPIRSNVVELSSDSSRDGDFEEEDEKESPKAPKTFFSTIKTPFQKKEFSFPSKPIEEPKDAKKKEEKRVSFSSENKISQVNNSLTKETANPIKIPEKKQVEKENPKLEKKKETKVPKDQKEKKESKKEKKEKKPEKKERKEKEKKLEDSDFQSQEQIVGNEVSKSKPTIQLISSKKGKVSSKKMKQLDLSSFFAGVSSPAVAKMNVPWTYTKLPKEITVSWARTIQPYQVKTKPEGCKYIEGSFSEIDLTSVGIMDAVLMDPPWKLDEDSDDPYLVTPEELAEKRFLDKILPRGLLFIWVEKEIIHRVIKMATKWGFEYVENIAWIKIHPHNLLHLEDYKFFLKSKLTVLMFKKVEKGGKLELRHQRNPDVVYDFVRIEPGERQETKPEAIYKTIEVLLPCKGPERIRFLEMWCRRNHFRKHWTSIHFLDEEEIQCSGSSKPTVMTFESANSEGQLEYELENVDMENFVPDDLESAESNMMSDEEDDEEEQQYTQVVFSDDFDPFEDD